MKITTLTIQQYMEISLITESFSKDIKKYQKKIIEYFDGSLDVSLETSTETLTTLEKVLKVEPNSVLRFEIDGIEYGRIPNLDKITTGEYIDLDEYMKDGKQLDRIMAILYRPVLKGKDELYKIEKYKGTDELVDVMKKVDFKIVKSAMIFFYNLKSSLLKITDIYTQRINQKKVRKKLRMMKRANLIKSLGGSRWYSRQLMKSI